MWTPDICSAAATDSRMALAVAEMSVTTPFRMPVEGASPTPRMATWSSPETSATRVQTLVVPMSRATTISLFATDRGSFQPVPADDGEVEEHAAAEGDHGREVQVLHANLIADPDQNNGKE